MLTALYSPDCELVGWLQPGKFLFDADMAYVAFIANGHLWSARSGRWIGPVIGPHIFDVEGRPVAWNPSEPLRTFGRPLRPVNVVRAVSPVRPPRPVPPLNPLTAPNIIGGWSAMSFRQWLVSSDPVVVEIIESELSVEPNKQPTPPEGGDTVEAQSDSDRVK